MSFFFSFFLPWRAKTATVAKLRDGFVVFFFFIGDQNRNFVKVKERKLLLSQNTFIDIEKDEIILCI